MSDLLLNSSAGTVFYKNPSEKPQTVIGVLSCGAFTSLEKAEEERRECIIKF